MTVCAATQRSSGTNCSSTATRSTQPGLTLATYGCLSERLRGVQAGRSGYHDTSRPSQPSILTLGYEARCPCCLRHP